MGKEVGVFAEGSAQVGRDPLCAPWVTAIRAVDGLLRYARPKTERRIAAARNAMQEAAE